MTSEEIREIQVKHNEIRQFVFHICNNFSMDFTIKIVELLVKDQTFTQFWTNNYTTLMMLVDDIQSNENDIIKLVTYLIDNFSILFIIKTLDLIVKDQELVCKLLQDKIWIKVSKLLKPYIL